MRPAVQFLLLYWSCMKTRRRDLHDAEFKQCWIFGRGWIFPLQNIQTDFKGLASANCWVEELLLTTLLHSRGGSMENVKVKLTTEKSYIQIYLTCYKIDTEIRAHVSLLTCSTYENMIICNKPSTLIYYLALPISISSLEKSCITIRQQGLKH